MNLLLFLTLMSAVNPGPGATFRVEGPFLKPVVFWEDLNGDGQLDIWIRDVTGTIWINDGADPSKPFISLAYELLSKSESPIWRDGQWSVGTFYKDSELVFQPDQGWTVALDYNQEGQFREGMAPKYSTSGVLIPAIDGYWLAEGGCIRQRFQVMPSISLKQRRLSVTYPILQWRDLNQDGNADLFGPPVTLQKQGLVSLWSAVSTGDHWSQATSKLQISPELEIQQFQLGDLNDDGFQDLVVIARPSKDLSVFEELSFLVYLAEGHGRWQSTPLQTLKTRQNLWQTGPIEVNEQGIFIYYFKGIIRTLFKMDRYAWDQGGFVVPKPISEKWKVKDGNRDFIELSYDFNGDGLKDLLLEGEDGLQLFERAPVSGKDLPFSQNRRKLLRGNIHDLGNNAISIQIGGNSQVLTSGKANPRVHLTKERRTVLTGIGGQYHFWSFTIDDQGALVLERRLASVQ